MWFNYEYQVKWIFFFTVQNNLTSPYKTILLMFFKFQSFKIWWILLFTKGLKAWLYGFVVLISHLKDLLCYYTLLFCLVLCLMTKSSTTRFHLVWKVVNFKFKIFLYPFDLYYFFFFVCAGCSESHCALF